jgi:PIN domain nuclease of toxin-antitoxin system
MTYVVDTHALVWFLTKDQKLGRTAESILCDPGAPLLIPTIVLAEIAFLHNRGRIAADLKTTLQLIAGAANVRVYPLDEAVVRRLPTNIDIHDGILVGTAILLRNDFGEESTIITKDATIVASGLVPTVW